MSALETLLPRNTKLERSDEGGWVEVLPQARQGESHRLPFQERSGIWIADVRGDALADFDVRKGDQLVLARRPRAEHGDFAVLPLSAVRFPFGTSAPPEAHGAAGDTLTLWKVYPEPAHLRLSTGPSGEQAQPGSSAAPRCVTAPVDAPIHGVVVGVLRRPRRA